MGETLSYERHFLSAAWGDMPADEFQALVDDIAVHGQRDPIVIFDGAVLDGWHRYQACEQLLRNVKAIELDAEEDPVAWVISKNAKRRSLNAGQRAMAVAECQQWAPEGKPVNSAPGAELRTTTAQMAAQAGVGTRTVEQAKKVITEASPEVKAAVKSGKVSVKQAAEALKKQPAKQKTKPAKNKAEPSAEQAQVLDDAYGESDPLQMLENMQKQAEELTALVAVADASDQKAEALKWRRAYDAAVRSQSEAMDRAKQATDREAWTMKQLRRCGKAVGQDDPSKIAAAVEAAMRERAAA